MLVADNGGHKIYCETSKIHVGENNNHVRIFTTFDGSREPDYKQTKFEAFLTDEELAVLRQSLA
jgi:hypothetical protein